MTRTVSALAAALLTASCGAPLLKLPTGPFAPAPDAADALAQSIRACRAVTTITAEVVVRGSVAGRRVRARLLVGLAAPESARLEAPAPFGQPVFIFVARAEDATLLLPREGRVIEHGRPDDILEALTGIALSPSDLRSTLTGCAGASEVAAARHAGDGWRVIPGAREVYLRRERPADSWRVAAVVNRQPTSAQWRAEFRDFRNDLPQTIHLISGDRRRFDLTLALSQVEINTALGPDVFRVTVPAGLKPTTVEELQRNGPLADAGGAAPWANALSRPIRWWRTPDPPAASR